MIGTSEFEAIAHPNIALVKYWGKSNLVSNIPAVPSLSITLGGLATRTRVLQTDGDCDEFFFEGQRSPEMEDRVFGCLEKMRRATGFRGHLRVHSENNFPTAAGLASSASGFAALVVAADALMLGGLSRRELADIARQASGSAARSLYGGYVELSLEPDRDMPTLIQPILGPDEWPLEIVIAITSSDKKEVSSSLGMESSRRNSPYYEAWVDGAKANLIEARKAIRNRDFQALAEISEHSCLKMHGLMMAARPGLLYFKGATLDALHRIRDLRQQGVAVFFTVDAGPQVKAVCLPQARETVQNALAEIPGIQGLLHSKLGEGARILKQ